MPCADFLGSFTSVCYPGLNEPPKQALQSVQWSCPVEYLMKAILGWLWAVAVVIGR